jgi:hypothetical protein
VLDKFILSFLNVFEILSLLSIILVAVCKLKLLIIDDFPIRVDCPTPPNIIDVD